MCVRDEYGIDGLRARIAAWESLRLRSNVRACVEKKHESIRSHNGNA